MTINVSWLMSVEGEGKCARSKSRNRRLRKIFSYCSFTVDIFIVVAAIFIDRTALHGCDKKQLQKRHRMCQGTQCRFAFSPRRFTKRLAEHKLKKNVRARHRKTLSNGRAEKFLVRKIFMA